MRLERNQFALEVFFDGDCPLCSREMRLLQSFDRDDRIRFVNTANSDSKATTRGVSQVSPEDRLHGRLPDGTLLVGVEVFRRAYAEVGFSSFIELTGLPGIDHLASRSPESRSAPAPRLVSTNLDRSNERVNLSSHGMKQ